MCIIMFFVAPSTTKQTYPMICTCIECALSFLISMRPLLFINRLNDTFKCKLASRSIEYFSNNISQQRSGKISPLTDLYQGILVRVESTNREALSHYRACYARLVIDLFAVETPESIMLTALAIVIERESNKHRKITMHLFVDKMKVLFYQSEKTKKIKKKVLL